jgi:hypothetical protein
MCSTETCKSSADVLPFPHTFVLRAVQRCIRTVDALAAQALLDADPPTRRLRMRIRLNVDDGDVRQALLVCKCCTAMLSLHCCGGTVVCHAPNTLCWML